MIKRILSIAVGLTAVFSCFAGPEAKWITTYHDFGAFDEDDGKATCTFKFVNTGDEPVVIKSVKATCGCTTTSHLRTPVEPGDTGTISVTYNPVGRPGRFFKRILVDLNTPEGRTTLSVRGVVIGASNTLRSRYPIDGGFMKLRTTVVPFGEVIKGESKSAFLDVYNSSEDSIRPVWRNVPPYLELSYGEKALAPGEHGAVTLFLDTKKTPLYGVVTDSLTIAPDDSSEGVVISTVAILKEDFSKIGMNELGKTPVAELSVETIDLGVIDRDGGKLTRVFTVTNNGIRDLILRRVYSGDPGIGVEYPSEKIKKGDSCKIKVTVDPKAISGDIVNSRLSVISNDAINPQQTVRIVGTFNK